jgi:hypothetical protein
VRDLIVHRDVFKVTTILSSNSLQRDLPEVITQSIDLTFLFKFDTGGNGPEKTPLFHKMYRKYGKIAFSTADEFCDAVSQLRPERHCIVLDHRTRSARAHEF